MFNTLGIAIEWSKELKVFLLVLVSLVLVCAIVLLVYYLLKKDNRTWLVNENSTDEPRLLPIVGGIKDRKTSTVTYLIRRYEGEKINVEYPLPFITITTSRLLVRINVLKKRK